MRIWRQGQPRGLSACTTRLGWKSGYLLIGYYVKPISLHPFKSSRQCKKTYTNTVQPTNQKEATEVIYTYIKTSKKLQNTFYYSACFRFIDGRFYDILR